MSSIKNHINAFLLLAGFILMAGGGAELVRSEQDPEPAGAVEDPPGAQDFFPEQNIIPQWIPIPLAASDPESVVAFDPEQPAINALDPEVAAAEAPEEADPNYTGQLESYATGNMLRFIEGSFGALVMVGAGLGAILAGAFGAYKAAISLLFVALGAFILRALVSLFFGGGYDAYTTGGVELVGGG